MLGHAFAWLKSIKNALKLISILELNETKHLFPSFEGNWVIENCVTRLIRGKKLIGVTQSIFLIIRAFLGWSAL